ncbi:MULTISPECIES: XRE family transcriptional regulator [Saccharothrix]|uniref:XRE family transcriptional regulator n=1 Tax=Saccharothrix TaxID=2071 RepID=UPI00093BC5D3|nr:XRE family transcriptional regulator [Saccharothrix sp. CB00851]OKI33108.1 hypothetical protein A6A25_04665 [Saccharothrix sp. CB00851]
MEGLAPPEVRDAAEFTAALRELRVRTGLSYRQLERRAERAGDVLPASTLSTALSRNTLPRQQLLSAYIRACGGDDQVVQAWTDLRTALAVATVNPVDGATGVERVADPALDPAPDPAPAPDSETARDPAPAHDPASAGSATFTRRRLTVVAGVLAVVAMVVFAVVLADGNQAPAQNNAAPTSATTTTAEPALAPTSTEPSSQQPPTTTSAPQPPPQAPPVTTTTTKVVAPQPPPAQGPKDGVQRIRLAHSGLCVGEGPEPANPDRIVLGQYDCAAATPPTGLERLADGTYRIKLHNVEHGLGCATVDYGGSGNGLLLAGDYCDENRPEQRFTLEPANGGYRLRSVPGAASCIGILGGRTGSGVQLIQNPCDGQASQSFVFG